MLKTLAIYYIAFSLVATIVVARSRYFDRVRKLFQAVVVWLLPIIGALVMLVFHSIVHRNMTTKAEPDRPSNNSDDVLADHTDFD